MIFASKKTPKGPAWKKPLTIVKTFSGFEIKFTTPERGDAPGLDGDEYPENEFDLFGNDFEAQENIDGRKSESIFEKPIYAEGWKFYGNPLIERNQLGHVVCGIRIGQIKDLPVNRSLMQREELLRQLERLFSESDIGGYHTGYGETEDPFDLTEYRWPNCLAPLNSQWIKINGVEWLYAESLPLHHLSDSNYWITPLTHDRYLIVRYFIQRYCANSGNPFRSEEATPIIAYRELGERLMSTMQLKLPREWHSERKNFRQEDIRFPLPELDAQKLPPAVYTMYQWSGAEYFGKNRISDEDPRAPREQVAAFIHRRIQPRPLPGCIAITEAPAVEDPASLNTNWTGAIEHTD